MGKLVVKIDDKEIETKIKEKQVALEIYDDSIAGGKASVMAERGSDEMMKIKLGNLGPL